MSPRRSPIARWTSSISWFRALCRSFAVRRDGRRKPRHGSLRLEALEDRITPSAGALDLTFDSDGIVTTSIGTGDDFARSIVQDANGKVVVAGQSFDGTNYDFAVVRYNADGSLDTTFGGSGKVTTPVGTGDDAGYALTIDGYGRII